jgi:hypothetical protein
MNIKTNQKQALGTTKKKNVELAGSKKKKKG